MKTLSKVTWRNFTRTVDRKVNTLHVSTSLAEVDELINEAVDRWNKTHAKNLAISQYSREKLVALARKIHQKNYVTYLYVMGGRRASL